MMNFELRVPKLVTGMLLTVINRHSIEIFFLISVEPNVFHYQ